MEANSISDQNSDGKADSFNDAMEELKRMVVAFGDTRESIWCQ
jgi:hypothetical protein